MILEKSWKCCFSCFFLLCKVLVHFVPMLPEGGLALEFSLRFKQMRHVMGELMNEILFYVEV